MLAGVRFLFSDRLLRVWTPALTLLDVCWTLFFASLPVLVVTKYGANPHILGWLFGALGGGALVGALVALRIVRRIDPLALTAVAFLCQMAAMWGVAVPAPWGVPLVAHGVGGLLHVARQRADAGVDDAAHPAPPAGAGAGRVRRLHSASRRRSGS